MVVFQIVVGPAFYPVQASGRAVVAAQASDPVVAVAQAFDLAVAAAQAAEALTSCLVVEAYQVASASDQAVVAGVACQVAVAVEDPCSSAEAFLAVQVAWRVDHPSGVVGAFQVLVADHLEEAFLACPCLAEAEDLVESLVAFVRDLADLVGNVEASDQDLEVQAVDPSVVD